MPESRPSTRKRYPQRALQPSDRSELKRLHEDWFPVRYTEDFYNDIVHNVIGKEKAPTWSSVAYEPGTATEPPSPQQAASAGPNSEENGAVATPRLHSNTSSSPSDRMVGCVICQVVDESKCLDPGLLEGRGSRPQPSKRQRACTGDTEIDCKSARLHEKADLESGFEENELGASSAGQSGDENDEPTAEQLEDQLMYVLTLGTDARCRRTGVAAALLTSAEAHARTQPRCRAIYLHVITYNKAALQFYEKHGFSFLRRIPDYYLIDGCHYACYLYIKYLDGPPPPFRSRGLMPEDRVNGSDEITSGLALALSNGSAAALSIISSTVLAAVYPATFLWQKIRDFLVGSNTASADCDSHHQFQGLPEMTEVSA